MVIAVPYFLNLSLVLQPKTTLTPLLPTQRKMNLPSPPRLHWLSPFWPSHASYTFAASPWCQAASEKQLPIRFWEIYHGLSPKVRMLILQDQSWQLGRSGCQGSNRVTSSTGTVWRQAQVWIMPGHPRLSKAGRVPVTREVRFALIIIQVPI